MTLTTKQQIIVLIVCTAAGVAVGRFTVPVKVVTETKVVEVEKKDTKSDVKTAVNKHKKVTITKDKKPNGEVLTTTTIAEDTDTKKDDTTKTDVAVSEQTDTKKEVIKDSGHLTISALAGANPFNLTTQPGILYGVHVERDIIGPIGIGIWGLSNGSCGLSVGLRF